MDEEILREKMHMSDDFMNDLFKIMLLCAENDSDNAELSFQIRDKKIQVSFEFRMEDVE